MSYGELFLAACSLSMDALAIAIAIGLALSAPRLRHGLSVGAYFGIFQAVMPILGFLIANVFNSQQWLYARYGQYVAAAALAGIALKMAMESRHSQSYQPGSNPLLVGRMLLLACATSIDALIFGFSLAFRQSYIWPSALLIGVVTFAICYLGVFLGSYVGLRLQSRATLGGALVLLLLALKTLIVPL